MKRILAGVLLASMFLVPTVAMAGDYSYYQQVTVTATAAGNSYTGAVLTWTKLKGSDLFCHGCRFSEASGAYDIYYPVGNTYNAAASIQRVLKGTVKTIDFYDRFRWPSQTTASNIGFYVYTTVNAADASSTSPTVQFESWKIIRP